MKREYPLLQDEQTCHVRLRLPEALHAKLRDNARENKRSMNYELIVALEERYATTTSNGGIAEVLTAMRAVGPVGAELAKLVEGFAQVVCLTCEGGK